MRRTGLVFDERFLRHDTGPGHPERIDRLRAIQAALTAAGLFERTTAIPAEPVDMKWVEAIHQRSYITRLHEACRSGRGMIDTPDSTICSESYEIARVAVGGTLAAVDAVMQGRIDNAFCAVRPPGHHAEHDRSMGFCLFNNIAIAANYLRQAYRLERVLILDWDVHHGNGTQHTFEADGSVFFCSIHEHPKYLFPGTGYAYETGRGEGAGKTLNIPLLPHAMDHDVRLAYEELFVPAARTFGPQFILVSAGFDAHIDDPLASLDWSDEAFAWLTDRTIALADELCGGRTVSLLEGGYDLGALRRCVTQHVELLLQDEHPDPKIDKAEHDADAAAEKRRASRHAPSDAIWWW